MLLLDLFHSVHKLSRKITEWCNTPTQYSTKMSRASVLYWANRQSTRRRALYGIDVWLFRLRKSGLAKVRENVRFYQTINVTRLIVLENYVRNFGGVHTFAHVYTTHPTLLIVYRVSITV